MTAFLDRQKALLVGGLVVAIVVGVGCASESPSRGLDQPRRCQRASDCPGDQQCRKTYCTVRRARSRCVEMRFIPPNSSAFLEQLSSPRSISSGDSLEFALQPSLEIEGTIVNREDSQPATPADQLSPPSGTLVFRRSNRPSGRVHARETVSEGEFAAFVQRGTYDITFIPSDPSNSPSKIWRNRRLTSPTRIELRLPRLIEISGSLLFRPDLASEERERGVRGARVFAVASDGSYTSTVATTQNQGGYTLRLASNIEAYDLHVRPASEETLVPSRVFKRAIRIDESGATSRTEQMMGRFPAPERAVSVSLRLRAPDAPPESINWSGTRLVLEAPSIVKNGQLTERAIVDNEGRASLELLPARYDLRVIPPADTPLVGETFCLDLTGQAEGECRSPTSASFELEVKPQVTGTILDSTGVPVSGAQVAFAPLERQEGEPPRAWHVSATTGAGGKFDVRLEERPYLVRITPESDSGYPRTFRRLEAEQFTDDGVFELSLAEPLYVSGRVWGRSRSDELAPVRETTIEVIEPRAGRRLVLGQARADGEGRFGLSLPAPNEAMPCGSPDGQSESEGGEEE